jgi:hypothetical protein
LWRLRNLKKCSTQQAKNDIVVKKWAVSYSSLLVPHVWPQKWKVQ